MAANRSGAPPPPWQALPSALSQLERLWTPAAHARRRLSPPGLADYVCEPDRMSDGMHRRHTGLLHPKLRGVNLGGWMILQPWVTPSLFYQFEEKPPDKTAMDMHGFCKVLGTQEGNRQLREHWAKWVTEADLEALVAQGVNAVRIPVADWMWEPYEPFELCTAGSLHELQRVLRICDRIQLRVLIDLHGAKARSLVGWYHMLRWTACLCALCGILAWQRTR